MADRAFGEVTVIYRLLKQLVGYTRCRISGADCGRLLMICRARRIYLWEIRGSDNGETEAFVLTPYAAALSEAAAICGGTVKILEEYGLPVYVKKAAAHRAFLIGLFAACLIVYSLSRYVWAIEVNGNSFYTDEVLSAYLKEINAGAGCLKKNIVPSAVEENLRLKYPRISWVSAQLVGTKLKINIEEGQPEREKNEDSKTEIKAPYSGTVLKIMTRSGTAAVRQGDIVKKGDILVRGGVDIYSDDGTVLKTVPTAADADIVLDVTFKVDRSYDRHYVKKIYDDDVSKSYILHVFGKTVQMPGFFEKEMTDYDEMSSYKAFRLTKDFYLPFGLETIQRQAYITENAVYTEDEIREIAAADFKRKLQSMEDEGARLAEDRTKVRIDNDCLTLYGEVSMEIPICG